MKYSEFVDTFGEQLEEAIYYNGLNMTLQFSDEEFYGRVYDNFSGHNIQAAINETLPEFM
jgi:hypothetical protein